MRGRDIRALRKRRGMRLADLRRALGWNTDRLVQVENERVLPLPEDEEMIILEINELAGEREQASAAA